MISALNQYDLLPRGSTFIERYDAAWHTAAYASTRLYRSMCFWDRQPTHDLRLDPITIQVREYLDDIYS